MDTKTFPSLLSLKVALLSEVQNQNVDNGIVEGDGNSVKLPAALEQALAFKTERAKEVGGDPNDIVPASKSPRDDSEELNMFKQIKAYRNTVPIRCPRHWHSKREFLQGKRDIKKPPFDLPDFMKCTSIAEMRASLQEGDDIRTLKAKVLEPARPKFGEIDIDYQNDNDAFLKWKILNNVLENI